MAFGFSNSSQKLEYDLNRNQIMGYAITAIGELGWGLFSMTDDNAMAEIYEESEEAVYLLDITAQPQKLFIKASKSQGVDNKPEINKKNEELFINKFNELLDVITKEEAATKFSEFLEEIENNKQEEKTSFKEGVNSFFSLFKPHEGYFFTPILAIINIVVFILMLISGVHIITPTSEAIISWGGNFAPLTQSGEWWRLITANFLHIGIIHLAFNMWALFYVGSILEPMIGKVKFLIAFLLTGLSSAVLSTYFHSNNVSAGASGAIFGLFGVLLALTLTNYIDKRIRNNFLKFAAFFIVANLLYGMKDGIDNAGHIGGLIGGTVIGFAFYPLLVKPREKAFINTALALITLVFIGISTLAFSAIPKSEIADYQELTQEFVALEQEALEVYNKFETSSTNYILYYLEDKGVKNWERGIEIAKEAQALNINSKLKEYSKGLEEYCILRRDAFKLMIKAISEDTDVYDNTIEEKNAKIDSVIGELNKY